MLQRPLVGFLPSSTRHNVQTPVLCDWIEGSALVDGLVSKSDVINELLRHQIYSDQDFASELVDDAWQELKRRRRLLGPGYPFSVSGRQFESLGGWEARPDYSFCLLLSFAEWFGTFAHDNWPHDAVTRGALFERLVLEAAATMLESWVVRQTGWSQANPENLHEVVTTIASQLEAAVGVRLEWTDERAKDAGVDLLLYRPFPDDRQGIPLYLMQCASGKDWTTKRGTPNLDEWRLLVQFTVMPKRAFALPYALSSHDFRDTANIVGGLVFDRIRLLGASRQEPNWMSTDLSSDLEEWVETRIGSLPLTEENA